MTDAEIQEAREHRLATIERFLDKYGISATRFGVEIMNDTSLMTRLRNGGGVHADTLLKIDQYIARTKAEHRRLHGAVTKRRAG